MNRHTELHRSEWNKILLEISYVPQWMPPHIVGEGFAHLEVRSLYPTAAPLPISETGYRSHFVAASVVAAAGGPVAYVDMWLEEEGQAPDWRVQRESVRQPTLF